MNKVIILSGNDWEALYVNGESVWQSHGIDLKDLNEYAPIEHIDFYLANEELEDFALDTGYFPRSIEEVVKLYPTIVEDSQEE